MSFDTEIELHELQRRIEGSAHYQDRASKKMLLALIVIVYRLALNLRAFEESGRDS